MTDVLEMKTSVSHLLSQAPLETVVFNINLPTE